MYHRRHQNAAKRVRKRYTTGINGTHLTAAVSIAGVSESGMLRMVDAEVVESSNKKSPVRGFTHFDTGYPLVISHRFFNPLIAMQTHAPATWVCCHRLRLVWFICQRMLRGCLDTSASFSVFPNGKHDDQIDPTIDAIADNLVTGYNLSAW